MYIIDADNDNDNDEDDNNNKVQPYTGSELPFWLPPLPPPPPPPGATVDWVPIQACFAGRLQGFNGQLPHPPCRLYLLKGICQARASRAHALCAHSCNTSSNNYNNYSHNYNNNYYYYYYHHYYSCCYCYCHYDH